MILTITTTHSPATDLGFLLYKNPSRVHRKELPDGEAVVFYPEVSEERCTAVLMVDVDPVGLVRGRPQSTSGGLLEQYVNDRPYVASSLLTTAIVQLFGTALSGTSKERQSLAESAIPLEFSLPAIAIRRGSDFAKRLFEPLGYEVDVSEIRPGGNFDGKATAVHQLRLKGTLPLHRALEHLVVLIPVLDGTKHYWVGEAEVDKLLRRGESWLPAHPLNDEIVRAYLRNNRVLVNEAFERLATLEGQFVDEDQEEAPLETAQIAAKERRSRLHDIRLDAVNQKISELGAKSVLDFGCGEGQLLKRLVRESKIERILGVDVSSYALERAKRNLKLDRLPGAVASRITLSLGSVFYWDPRWKGFDLVAVVEVIEHLELDRLSAFEKSLFELARPGTILLTSPNREYNVRYAGVEALRHEDHRFEWTRVEFFDWAQRVASEFGYTFEVQPLGPEDPEVGAPSQMAVFRLKKEAA